MFSAVDGPDGVILSPRSDTVNTNAYYFVDVVAERGPAVIVFQTKQRGLLGAPVVVAASGVTNYVPLLIGASYAVTSNVPFQMSVRPGDDALICTNNSRRMTINWPLTFSFVEEVSSSNRRYTVSVSPERVEDLGLLSWKTQTNGIGCACWTGVNRLLTFSCASSGACIGGCTAHGSFTREGVPFMVSGGECRCGFEDPALPDYPNSAQTNGANVSVALSASAVIFEESFVDSYVTVKPRRSSRVALTISANGGPHGGTLHLQSQNLDKLRMVELGPRVLPTTVEVAPCQSYSESHIYEAEHASGYFTNRYYQGRLGHTTSAGAGNWLPVDLDNKFAEDTAAFNDIIPWLTPNGTVTQDPVFSWTDGSVYIDNPFGWNSVTTRADDPPHKMFAVDTQGEIVLFSNGKVGVRKLCHQVSRETNGVIRLNGRMMTK